MAKFERRRTRQMGKAVRVSMLVVFLGLVIMVLVVYKLYSRVFVPNVVLDTAHELFYIPSGSSYEDVYNVTFDSTENGFIPTYHTQTVDVYDTIDYYSISEAETRYTYLDIPILIGHEWNFNRVSLFLHGGPSVSILLGRSSAEADYPDENIRILNESPQIPAREQINWQVMAGAGFSYSFTNKVSFSLEPTFRYYLTNDYKKGTLNTRHPYSFGIRAGLIYHINH